MSTETTTLDKPATEQALVAGGAAPANAVAIRQEPQSQEEAVYMLRRRQASDYAKSELVPEQYRGKPANVIIAMEIADRIGASHLAVMQQLYIVKGRPSFSSQFLIATVNASGRFTPLRFEVDGTDPHNENYRVRAVATDVKTGDECKGTWITWKMVKGESWGAKWKTIPEQMFCYRAATFWTRLFAPEISMGILTHEEARDMGAITLPESAVQRTDLKTLEAHLLRQEQPQQVTDAEMDGPAIPCDGDGVVLTRADFEAKFKACTTADDLHTAFDLTRGMTDQEDRTYLLDVYEKRLDELEA